MAISFREPVVEDGPAIYELVRDSRVLDVNSRYVYLLWSQYFSGSSLVACDEDGLLGFVNALRVPDRPEALFVWQIAVAVRARGAGLGKALLGQLLAQPQHRQVSWLEAHVGESNQASAGLFRSIARQFGADVDVSSGLGRELFGDDGHEAERLFRIGPLDRSIESKND